MKIDAQPTDVHVPGKRYEITCSPQAGKVPMDVSVISGASVGSVLLANFVNVDISSGTYSVQYTYATDFVLDNILLNFNSVTQSPYVELNFGSGKFIYVENWPTGYFAQNIALIEIDLAVDASLGFGLRIVTDGSPTLLNGSITIRV